MVDLYLLSFDTCNNLWNFAAAAQPVGERRAGLGDGSIVITLKPRAASVHFESFPVTYDRYLNMPKAKRKRDILHSAPKPAGVKRQKAQAAPNGSSKQQKPIGSTGGGVAAAGKRGGNGGGGSSTAAAAAAAAAGGKSAAARPQASSGSNGIHSSSNTSSAGGASLWHCRSVIDRQASEAVGRLLLAAETRSGGATIKSLTLAPHVVHKKPTFAVTCQTLKCERWFIELRLGHGWETRLSS